MGKHHFRGVSHERGRGAHVHPRSEQGIDRGPSEAMGSEWLDVGGDAGGLQVQRAQMACNHFGGHPEDVGGTVAFAPSNKLGNKGLRERNGSFASFAL